MTEGLVSIVKKGVRLSIPGWSVRWPLNVDALLGVWETQMLEGRITGLSNGLWNITESAGARKNAEKSQLSNFA